jgi:hypothetical protein
MATNKTNDTLTTYVSDVHALVSHGIEAIHRQVEQLKNVSHRDASAAVIRFEGILRKQESELQDRIRALGGSTSQPLKDVVATVTGVAAGLINAVRASETVKSIRDDYTFISQLGIAWLMLHTTASSLGDVETTRLAERGYADTAKMIMLIDRIMPKIVIEELREDEALRPDDTQEQTHSMVRQSWQREAQTGM